MFRTSANRHQLGVERKRFAWAKSLPLQQPTPKLYARLHHPDEPFVLGTRNDPKLNSNAPNIVVTTLTGLGLSLLFQNIVGPLQELITATRNALLNRVQDGPLREHGSLTVAPCLVL
jgi:hypothetical protein